MGLSCLHLIHTELLHERFNLEMGLFRLYILGAGYFSSDILSYTALYAITSTTSLSRFICIRLLVCNHHSIYILPETNMLSWYTSFISSSQARKRTNPSPPTSTTAFYTPSSSSTPPPPSPPPPTSPHPSPTSSSPPAPPYPYSGSHHQRRAYPHTEYPFAYAAPQNA